MPPDDQQQTPPPADEKKFSQADLERHIADRLKKVSDYDSVKAQAAKAAELETELTRLREEAELVGKSAAEQAAKRAEQAEKKWRADIEARDKLVAEHQATASAAATKLRSTLVGHQITSALVEAKVYGPALTDALSSLIASGDIETDDDHKVVAITVGDKRHTSLKDASAAFLALKPHFAAAPNVNGGANTRSGVNGGHSKPFHELSDAEKRQRAFAALVPS